MPLSLSLLHLCAEEVRLVLALLMLSVFVLCVRVTTSWAMHVRCGSMCSTMVKHEKHG
jgi:hypothetical protein